jgi:hypothetical protein
MVENNGNNSVDSTSDALHRELQSLHVALQSSGTLSNAQRSQVAEALEEMKKQLLAAPAANASTLRAIWSDIEHLVTAGDVIDYGLRVARLLEEMAE